MKDDFIAVGAGDLPLQIFDFGRHKFYNLAAFEIDDVIMMRGVAGFKPCGFAFQRQSIDDALVGKFR